MNNIVNVKIIALDNSPMERVRLETLYCSDLHFEPIRRVSEIKSDGSVDLRIIENNAMLHCRIDVPDFGDIWVHADNCGIGYLDCSVTLDFVFEACKSRIKDVDDILRSGEYSAECISHRTACSEFLKYASKAKNPGYFHLKALSHALWAGEYAVVERARNIIATRPKRTDFMFGGNAFRYEGNTPYAKYFKNVFNFATLPFYLSGLEIEEGKPDYSLIDKILNWCKQEGIVPKGHPLWWGNTDCTPNWLKGASWNDLKEHCERVVGRSVERYRDSIQVWDVINEGHDFANGFNLTHEQEIEITKICCDTTRDKNPNAIMIVNNCAPFAEYVADGVVAHGPVLKNAFSPLSYLNSLMEAKVDFDVIGVQLYFPVRDMLSVSKLLDEYARFGKPIHITEMGVSSQKSKIITNGHSPQLDYTNGSWHNEWSEKVQADWLEWFYTLAYSREEITALTWWDFSDPAFINKGGFLNEDETSKEIYLRLKALRQKF